MASGVDIRAQIDTEVVRGLLLVNGGAAVALLAFLPAIMDRPEYRDLTPYILFGLLFFIFALAAALVHNRLRRVCSLTYQQAWAQSQQPAPCPPLFRIFRFNEPCVCIRSIAWMWSSLGLFVIGGLTVFWGAWAVMG